jgi:hypothetical protein
VTIVLVVTWMVGLVLMAVVTLVLVVFMLVVFVLVVFVLVFLIVMTLGPKGHSEALVRDSLEIRVIGKGSIG